MATRELTSGQEDAAAAPQKAMLAFVELDFSSGFVRVTNAAHPITWNGFTWQGVGALGRIDTVKEVLGIEATALKFTISGVDPDNIAIALGENYQGRSARMWLAFAETGGIVADPNLVFAGRIDQMAISDGVSATISVTAESRLAFWARPKMRRFSDADQREEFPGDLGMQYISELASGREIPWGVT